MAIMKGTGFSKILQKESESYKKRYGVNKNTPTDSVVNIMMRAIDKYFELHPSSKKTQDSFHHTKASKDLLNTISNSKRNKHKKW